MDALWALLILYSAVAVRMFCTFGLEAYQIWVVPRTGQTWIRACAILGFALGAALWLVFVVGAAMLLAGKETSKGGSPC